ncbi:hypothetical protein [Aureimonas mangrovi]|uniref:hypothetical protein n=1 Tax=Aureimonas mangrovi TaxID=2758041 RepID=UPI00163D6E9D|nr:hypothetical protein [Aureimonas mangrovi]
MRAPTKVGEPDVSEKRLPPLKSFLVEIAVLSVMVLGAAVVALLPTWWSLVR